MSAQFPHWTLPLEARHMPYVFPCENGLRCGTPRLQIGKMSIAGTFHVSISRFSQQQLRKVTPRHLLRQEPGGWLTIDGYHMGVGGDDSRSPSVSPEYLLSARRYHYGLTLKATT